MNRWKIPLRIGGIVGMVLGLMFVPRPSRVPKRSTNAFIHVVNTGAFRQVALPLLAAGLVAFAASALIRNHDAR